MRPIHLNFKRVAAVAGLALCSPASASAAQLLAESAYTGSYVSYWRMIWVMLLLLAWLAFCQWVGRDAPKIRRMNHLLWYSVVLGGGALGLAVLLLAPWNTPQLFMAGYVLWLVLVISVCSIYVVVRNSYVDPGARVFTPTHIKLWFGNIGKGKADQMDTVERVRVVRADGEKNARPDDKEKAVVYDLLQDLLFDAFWRRTTEVDMVMTPKGTRMTYRIDGVLTPRNDLLEAEQFEPMMAYLKEIAGLNPDEHRRPQEGSFRGGITGGQFQGTTEVEVFTSGTTQEEKLTMQIVGDHSRFRVSDLGMSKKQLELFEKYADEPGGLMVISGPRGSGVTSTQYAALRTHDSFMQNLLTIEREKLMDMENITQHIYDSTKHEASYARQLQTVLRREPDVVMVSDCPDRETAHLAVKGACDNKKIYLGVMARDSFEALKKVVSLAGDTEAVAEALQLITCQRLIRKLCVACRVAYKPDPNLLKKANLPVDKIEHFYRPPKSEEMIDDKGRPKPLCPNCQGSGYFGRTAVFEVLEMNDAIRGLIRKGQSLNHIRAAARKNGMLYLQEAGLQKVIEGVTSMNEVLRGLRDEEPTPVVQPAATTTKKGG